MRLRVAGQRFRLTKAEATALTSAGLAWLVSRPHTDQLLELLKGNREITTVLGQSACADDCRGAEFGPQIAVHIQLVAESTLGSYDCQHLFAMFPASIRND